MSSLLLKAIVYGTSAWALYLLAWVVNNPWLQEIIF